MLFTVKIVPSSTHYRWGVFITTKTIDFSLQIDLKIVRKSSRKYYNFYFMLEMVRDILECTPVVTYVTKRVESLQGANGEGSLKKYETTSVSGIFVFYQS